MSLPDIMLGEGLKNESEAGQSVASQDGFLLVPLASKAPVYHLSQHEIVVNKDLDEYENVISHSTMPNPGIFESGLKWKYYYQFSYL